MSPVNEVRPYNFSMKKQIESERGHNVIDNRVLTVLLERSEVDTILSLQPLTHHLERPINTAE